MKIEAKSSLGKSVLQTLPVDSYMHNKSIQPQSLAMTSEIFFPLRIATILWSRRLLNVTTLPHTHLSHFLLPFAALSEKYCWD